MSFSINSIHTKDLQTPAVHLGLFVSYGFALSVGYYLSSFLEAVPGVASWYIPAGLRFCCFLYVPKKYWPTLFLSELLVFNIVLAYVQYFNGQPLALFASIKAHWLVPEVINLIGIYFLGDKGKSLGSSYLAGRVLGYILAITFLQAFLRGLVDYLIMGKELAVNTAAFTGFWVGDIIGTLIVYIAVYVYFNWRSLLSGYPLSRLLFQLILAIGFVVFVSQMLSSWIDISPLYFIKLFGFGVVFLFVYQYRLLGSNCALFVIYASLTLSSGLSNNNDFWDFQVYIVGISVTAILMGALYSELSERNRTLNELVDNLEKVSGEKQRTAETAQDLAMRLTQNQEQERRRISRELHDDIGQVITALKTDIKLAERQNVATSIIQSLKQHADSIYKTVYHMLYRLHPTELEELGLTNMLKGSYFKSLLEKNQMTYVDRVEDIGELTDVASLAIYRIVQESLNNIIKHSGATECILSLRWNEGTLALTIHDNGHGFEVGNNSMNGFGLKNIQDRVISVKGSWEVQSDQKGTSVRVLIPASSAKEPS